MSRRSVSVWQLALVWLNIVGLTLLVFLAGYYLGNKNAFYLEANKRGDIMIIRK